MQKEAKAKIKALIDKYKLAVVRGKARKYTEEETKNVFIKPLFEALGWDFSEKDEVSAEESIISSGRVDYGFYINDRPKFYLEAKKLKVDLNVEEFARQAIRYSFNKGVIWAILTDFESIKVFNAQALSNYLGDKLYFEIKYSEYLDRFDQLWLLSKESFSNDLIDKEAEKAGKKLQRVPITELLFKDLNECRKILTEYLGKWNPKVPKDLLDEGVQKLLDRLIFIRVAEDRKIEHNILTPLINQWRSTTGKNKPELYESMRGKFRELDDTYDSDLFSPHPFEQWEDDGGALEKVINTLHGKEGYYEYDFSIMPADILGGVYENYLGYKLSQSKKGLTLDKAAGKRKEQGIYYTPTFIVDYIVRNALKPVLDRCKSVNDLMKIKVLDPACGSGSFLIKALDIINEKYKEFGYEGNMFTKIQIILQNLYGVDLDEQAVEIARLNLLINTLEEKGKLPSLDQNIKNGNSLISGTDEELGKYFGKNFRDKKPFSWEEEFPEVFKQGGFDVIIGNPPYVRQEEIKEYKEIFSNLFLSVANGTADLYVYFFERSIQLLKDGGYLGFITSNKFIRAGYGKNLRIYLKENFNIIQLIDEFDNKVFADAAVDPCIIIIEKEKPSKNHTVLYNKKTNVLQFSLNKNGWTFGNKHILDLKRNIESKGKKIKDWKGVDVLFGIKSGFNKAFIVDENTRKELGLDKDIIKSLLRGRDVGKYSINWQGLYLIFTPIGIDIKKYLSIFNYLSQFQKQLSKRTDYKPGVMDWYNLRPCDYYDNFEKPKIIYPDISDEGSFYWDDRGYFFNNTAYMISGNIKKSWVGLLNSKLMNWYYKKIASGLGKGGVRYFAQFVKELPIVENTEVLEPLTQKMLKLHNEFQKLPENSNKWNSIKSEIEKTDKKIDKEVYKLYGLTPEEIAVVEGKK